MAPSGLGPLLVRSGAVPPESVAAAERRCTVYGGPLDTVLLEMGSVDERTLAMHLAEALGLPAALPERLAGRDPEARTHVPLEEARRFGAVPLARKGNRLEVAVG